MMKTGLSCKLYMILYAPLYPVWCLSVVMKAESFFFAKELTFSMPVCKNAIDTEIAVLRFKTRMGL